MLDLDSTSVCEECAMVCTELQYEDVDEGQVVYRDEGISAEDHEKATCGDFMKTQSEEEEEIKCAVAQKANDSVIDNLMKTVPMRNQTVIISVTYR